MKALAVLLIALLFDLTLGDPPNRWHPVAWMGRTLATLCRFAPIGRGRCAYGWGVMVVGMGIWGSLGWQWEVWTDLLPFPVAVVLQALALKMTFSVRRLRCAALEVQDALEAGDLEQARKRVRYHLVSRPTDRLTPAHVVSAAIESVAENMCDSYVAPVFYYAIGGLPLAYAYRWINTADAMIGYRDPIHAQLGKAAARLDDGTNWIPARISALLIAAVSLFGTTSMVKAYRIWRRDARKTESPNAGHPMSAMAGALGVRLEKPNHYVLGEEFPWPKVGDIDRAGRLMVRGVGLWTALVGVGLGIFK